MIELIVKSDDNGATLLTYSKGSNSPMDLLTVCALGLPKIATADARKSYSAIDYLRKVMRDENVFNTLFKDIVIDEDSKDKINKEDLNTIFRYLNKDIDYVETNGNKVYFYSKKSALNSISRVCFEES